MNYIKNDKWKTYIDDNHLNEIMEKVNDRFEKEVVFPNKSNIFRAFELIDPSDVKVVILGQDPYHNYGQANGLAFSLNKQSKITPSLRNIFKELQDDIGVYRTNVDLEDLAKQGILFLNAILTVEKGKPSSHKNIGWEQFTDNIILKLQSNSSPIIFVLWGNYAKSKKHLINKDRHYIIESTHPSPFSANRGFFGSKPFSKINEILKKEYNFEIRWSNEWRFKKIK